MKACYEGLYVGHVMMLDTDAKLWIGVQATLKNIENVWHA